MSGEQIPYVDLDRVFYSVSEKEVDDAGTLAALADSPFSFGNLHWPDLLELPRVLILAQGGVGKTREMQEQTKRLIADGKDAFFIPLELLKDNSVRDILEFSDLDRFEEWSADHAKPGWFFLDSVDELKMSQGSLERALNLFSKSLGRDELRRARVYLSSRPKDWSETIDRPAVKRYLSLPKSAKSIEISREEAFVASLSKSKDEEGKKDRDAAESALKIVLLIPLDRSRTRRFADAIELPGIEAFMDEVTRRNADELVKRPMDLITLADMWRNERRLGTRRDQLRRNIETNLVESEGKHADISLPPDQAIEGAKRLALAMVLAKRTIIHAHPPTIRVNFSEDAINAAEVLHDWSQTERDKLLRLPIFDLAAVGQVRFHHTSIKDYLAVQRLLDFRARGMPWLELKRLLIVEKFGRSVIPPSVRPVAAWLALGDDDVRQALIELSPQTLISDGDPEALPISERAKLLSAFADHHGSGGWRGLGFDITQIRRLADPELGAVVRTLWMDGQDNAEVRDLLVDLMWHGPLPDCVDLAEKAAFDPSEDATIRSAAVKALLACEQTLTVERFVEEIYLDTRLWPNGSFCYLLDEFVPTFLSPERLVQLLRDVIVSPMRKGQLDWVMDQVVKKLAPLSDYAIALRDELTRLIEDGAPSDIEYHSMMSKFGVLSEALANCCAGQIVAGIRPDDALIRACVVAARYASDHYRRHDNIRALQSAISGKPIFREAVFWGDVEYLGALFPDKNMWWRAWRSADEDSLICGIRNDDVAWLETALQASTRERRILAQHQLIAFWSSNGRSEDLLQRLRAAVGDDAGLTRMIDDALKPPEENPAIVEFNEKRARHRVEQDLRERERVEKWTVWYRETRANPTSGFSLDNEELAVSNLLKWLAMEMDTDVSTGPWSSATVSAYFGDQVLEQARLALKRYWRRHRPLLWSERRLDEKQTFEWAWMYGLCAIKAECETEGWAASLTDEEVDLATRYAFIQFNGMPEYLDRLIASRPAIVKNLLSTELRRQFDAWEQTDGNLKLLQDLRYSGAAIQRLVAPEMVRLVEGWPSEVVEGQEGHSLTGLSNLLDILCENTAEVDVSALTELCVQRFLAKTDGAFATIWLRAIFRLEFGTGVNTLLRTISNPDDEMEVAEAVGFLAALFGDRGEIQVPPPTSPQRSELLTRLLQFAYRFVRPDQDQVHENSYSPNTRDHAERGRGAIFKFLIETPGIEARQNIFQLASDPAMASIADRMLMLADEQLAIDAEFRPYNSEEIRKFEQRHELIPRTSEELLAVALGRFSDLAHELFHGNFSMLKEWRKMDDEADPQRLLASWLHNRRGDAYTAVTREQQIAGGNKPDISLFTRDPNGEQLAIEVKVANGNRSAKSLARDLEYQLVEKYLRHASCRAGCFFVVDNGYKTAWRHPETRKLMSFPKMIEYLKSVAERLEEADGYKRKLSVFGLQLTNIASTDVR